MLHAVKHSLAFRAHKQQGHRKRFGGQHAVLPLQASALVCEQPEAKRRRQTEQPPHSGHACSKEQAEGQTNVG